MTISPRMPNPPDAERVLLAALCQRSANDPLRAEIHSLLIDYRWQSIDHRIIYETLADGRLGSADLPARLATRLTQLGFPDMEYEFCFEARGDSVEDALAWLRARMADGRNADPANCSSGEREPSPQ